MTNNYEFHNENPENKRINDCVSRAISAGTGLSYSTVNRLLAQTAERYGCSKLCVCCYKHLLSHIFGYRKYRCRPGIMVSDVASEFSEHIVIIRINEHLTCSKYGTIVDTWDCSDREVDCFWIVS